MKCRWRVPERVGVRSGSPPKIEI